MEQNKQNFTQKLAFAISKKWLMSNLKANEYSNLSLSKSEILSPFSPGVSNSNDIKGHILIKNGLAGRIQPKKCVKGPHFSKIV